MQANMSNLFGYSLDGWVCGLIEGLLASAMVWLSSVFGVLCSGVLLVDGLMVGVCWCVHGLVFIFVRMVCVDMMWCSLRIIF